MTKPTQQCLCRTAGAGVPYQIGGDLRIIQPLRLKDWGVIEQHLLLQQKKTVPLDNLTSDLLDVLRDETKVHKSVDLMDLFSYAMNPTTDGPSLRLWLALRQEVPYETCRKWISDLVKSREFRDIVIVHNQADGIDLFATMDWPERPAWLAADKKEKKAVDWKVELHALAELYCLDPLTFGELTLYQVRVLQWDLKSLQGKVTMSRAQLRGMGFAPKS